VVVAAEGAASGRPADENFLADHHPAVLIDEHVD
jgi:hypothetical protein